MSGDLHLHGIIEKGASHQESAPAHRIVSFPEFDALVGDYTLGADTAKVPHDQLATAAMKHHRILLAYCRDYALLPFRFGAIFSGPDVLASTMLKQQDGYAEALRALADRREYSIELFVEAAHVAPVARCEDGRTFLKSRRTLRDRRRSMSQDRQAIVDALRTQVTALSAVSPQHGVPKPEKALDMSVLLSPAATQELRDFATGIQDCATALGLKLSIRGPWPAYHFAQTDDRAEVRYGA